MLLSKTSKISITDEQFYEFLHKFNSFSNPKRLISRSKILEILKILGVSGVEHSKFEVKPEENYELDFEEYICYMSYFVQEENYEDEVMQACKIFDANGTGFAKKGELITILDSINAKISDEIDQILTSLEDSEGLIMCYQFVKLWIEKEKIY